MSEERLEREQETSEKRDSVMEEAEGGELVQATQNEVKRVVEAVIQREFSGPIPPPNIIEEYERVLPGSADRIIFMAEQQAKHRQRMEEKMINAESRDSLLGVICAFLLGAGCLVTAIVLVYLVPQKASSIASAVLGVTGIGSITSSFIVSTRRGKVNKNTDS